MRTYLTRLSMTAAGVALSAVSLTGVANANDGDGNAFVDPSVLEELGNLEPCDEITGSEDLVYPVDPDWEPDELLLPTEPDDPETVKPGADVGLVPCYQIPDEPEDGDDEPEGNDDDREPAGDGNDEPAGNGNGNTGGQGGQGSGSNGQAGDPNTGDGVGGEGAGDTASDETSQPQETVTPTAATGNDDNGALVLAMLAGLLGAVGLFLFVYGLRKRPRRGQQPA